MRPLGYPNFGDQTPSDPKGQGQAERSTERSSSARRMPSFPTVDGRNPAN